jgi:hypothetical protein
MISATVEFYYLQLGEKDRFGWTEPEGKVYTTMVADARGEDTSAVDARGMDNFDLRDMSVEIQDGNIALLALEPRTVSC